MKSISDFTPITHVLKKYYAKTVFVHPDSIDLADTLAANPKLICAVNHGSAPAPFAAVPAILDQYVRAGGGDRNPLIITWRGFYKVPLVRRLISFATQVDHAMKASDFMNKFENEGFTDLFVMPEGENCMFSDGDHIAPFLSPKFIELAIHANVPILVIVHNGTENMAVPFHLNAQEIKLLQWLPDTVYRRVRQNKILSYPHFGMHGLEKLGLLFQLYRPKLTLEELSDNPEERVAQIQVESDNVRHLMIEMKDLLENRKVEYPWKKPGQTIRRFSRPGFDYSSS